MENFIEFLLLPPIEFKIALCFVLIVAGTIGIMFYFALKYDEEHYLKRWKK